jgi:Holliday junction resolvasome RuvABC endonuclease subunit
MGVLGLDISLRSPGFAILDSETEALHISSLDCSELRGPERWECVLSHIKDLIDSHIVEIVCFENYGFSSFGQIAYVAEMIGVLKHLLYKRKISWGAVAPSSLKKYFTQSGTASKYQMLSEAQRRGFKVKNNDEADAVALASYGCKNGIIHLKTKWISEKINWKIEGTPTIC